GTALTMTLWSNREIYHHSQLVQHVSDNNPVYDQYLGLAREAGLTNTQTLGYINQLITQQSLLISANEIFYLSSFIFLSLTLLVWMAKPPFNT
ncbi:MAG: MFS transporter, partial [Citrobacter sp.]